MVINVTLKDDYTITSLDAGYTQQEINDMLKTLEWQAFPFGRGYISVSFYQD